MAIPGRAPLRAAQLFVKWLNTELSKEEAKELVSLITERIKEARNPARKPRKHSKAIRPKRQARGSTIDI